MSASVSALDSDPKTLAAIREKAAAILSNLDCKSAEGEAPSSWVRGGADDDRQDVTARCQFFDRNGFIHVPGFASESEINDMKQQMEELAREWDPAAKTSVFRTDQGQTKAQGSDDYFLSSASRVHFFAEKDATNDDGSLKPDFANNKVSMAVGVTIVLVCLSNNIPVHVKLIVVSSAYPCRWLHSTKPAMRCTLFLVLFEIIRLRRK